MKKIFIIVFLAFSCFSYSQEFIGEYRYRNYWDDSEILELKADNSFLFSYRDGGLIKSWGRTVGTWKKKDSIIVLNSTKKSLMKNIFGKVISSYNEQLIDTIRVTFGRMNKKPLPPGTICLFNRNNKTIVGKVVSENDTLKIPNENFDEVNVSRLGFYDNSIKITNKKNTFHIILEDRTNEEPFHFKNKKYKIDDNKLIDLDKKTTKSGYNYLIKE